MRRPALTKGALATLGLTFAWATFALATFALALAGCDDGTTKKPPKPEVVSAELEMELRDTLSITIEGTRYAFTMSAGYDIFPDGHTLEGEGHIDTLPEASATLYSVQMASETLAGGPCDGETADVSLSLHRQDATSTVVGGISVYCAVPQEGVPVRVIRLFGTL